MKEQLEMLGEDWVRVSSVLTQSRTAWPESAVYYDWAWFERRVARGELRAMPGRHTLARRWGWRENQVRRFLLVAQPPRQDGAFALPRRSEPVVSRVVPTARAGGWPIDSGGPHQTVTLPETDSIAASACFSGSSMDDSPGRQQWPSSATSDPTQATRLAPDFRAASMQKISAPIPGIATSPEWPHHPSTRVAPCRVNSSSVPASSASSHVASSEVQTQNAASPNTGKILERVAQMEIPGTKVDLLSSSNSSHTLSLDRERSSEERMPEIPANPPTPPVPPLQEMLRIAKRWSGSEAPKARRWRIDPLQDTNWFLLEILPMREAATLDLVDALKDWDSYLERIARAPHSPDIKRFPKNWKSALRKQILLKAEYVARQEMGAKESAPVRIPKGLAARPPVGEGASNYSLFRGRSQTEHDRPLTLQPRRLGTPITEEELSKNAESIIESIKRELEAARRGVNHAHST